MYLHTCCVLTKSLIGSLCFIRFTFITSMKVHAAFISLTNMGSIHEEARIMLPNRFDNVFKKGMFLNTTKPDDRLFFLFGKPTFQVIFP